MLIAYNGSFCRFDDFVRHAGVGDEHAAQIELLPALQAVFDIRLDAGFKRAAVFFADAHPAVFDLDCRAEL